MITNIDNNRFCQQEESYFYYYHPDARPSAVMLQIVRPILAGLIFVSSCNDLNVINKYNYNLHQLKSTLSVCRKMSRFMMTTKLSAVMIQTGRPTSSNDPTCFGSEITRLTGELLADTTQMAPYIQITWEPRLNTLTSSVTYPPMMWLNVDRLNMWTSGEMSVRIAQWKPGIKKGIFLCIPTVLKKQTVISTETRQTQPYKTRTTLDCIRRWIPNFVVLQAQMQRLSSGLEVLYDFPACWVPGVC